MICEMIVGAMMTIKTQCPTPTVEPGKSNYQIRQEEQRRQYLEELRKKRLLYSRESGVRYLKKDYTNDCVTWAKKKTGIYRTVGDGARAGIQGTDPVVGAIGAERYRSHAVVVTEIDGDIITIQESNYRKNWITERKLHRSDFLGFIYS